MAEMTMKWQKQKLTFRNRNFDIEHFDVGEVVSSSSDDSADDDETRKGRWAVRTARREKDTLLARCEAELGACLWLDTNLAALKVLEDWRCSYQGQRVLELGAGTGALGIALALDGANATVSDFDALLPLMRSNIELNELPLPPVEKKLDEAECAAPGAVNPVEGAGYIQEAAPRIATKTRSTKEETDDAPVSNRAVRAADRGRKQPGPRQRAGRAKAAAQAASLEKAQVGSCQALAVDWIADAKSPTLPAAAFDAVVVCDCLYDNQESWDALQMLLTRVMAAEGVVILASAILRKPFLDAFILQLEAGGFEVERREEGQRLGEVSVAILRLGSRPSAE